MKPENLESFIPTYPSPKDENFIYDVTRKKEFYDLRLDYTESTPEKGELLMTQQFIKRFFSPETPYKNCLIFHGLGTGKTCSASAIVENFKQIEVESLPRKPALVFVKSIDLEINYKKEISEICTKSIYLPTPTEKELEAGVEMTEQAETQRLNKKIAKSYEIVTYGTFLKHLPNDEAIKKNYSNRIIIIDEAHSLRIQPKHKKKEKYEGDEEEATINREESKMLYKNMHHFLHVVENCRIFLFSGTPIWDKTNEIASLGNLIFEDAKYGGKDEQLLTGNKFNYEYFDEDGKLINSERLSELFKGRVSFLRPIMTTAKREELGTIKPWLKYIKVFPDGMSSFQSKFVKDARGQIDVKRIIMNGKVVDRKIQGGIILRDARDASNFVFPVFDEEHNVVDGKFGQGAFKKYATTQITVKKGKTGQTTKTLYKFTDRFLTDELTNNLKEYSSKFASTIDDIINNPNEITFVYFGEFVKGAGAILFALCLQLRGYTWAYSSSDIAKPSAKKRFAVITSDPSTTHEPKQINKLLDSINKSDNKYAERLQVIIGSEKISIGFTIKNVRKIHIETPHWNISSIEQALYRGFRFGSHDALPEDERYIKIYRHVAVETADPDLNEKEYAKGKGYPFDVGFTKTQTVDLYIYDIAENKEFKNTQIYRLLKEVAPDCALNYKRNVLKSDVDGTIECDYQECNYECDGWTPNKNKKIWDYSIEAENLDYSTYNLFYSSNKLKDIIDKIVILFNKYFSLKLNVLQDLLKISDFEKTLLLQAIDIIVNSRLLIRNKYGFGSYLKEENNMIFLNNSISSISSYSENTYIQYPLITDKTTLESLASIKELKGDKENVLKFCKKPSKELFDNLSYKTKIILLEVAFEFSYRKLNSEQQKAVDLILDILGDKIYEVSDGNFIHILYTEEFKGVSYDVAAKSLDITSVMRMFDKKLNTWRTVTNLSKEKEYIEKIKMLVGKQREDCFKDNPYGICGWISKKDKEFRIDIKSEKEQIGKFKTRGGVCQSPNFHVKDLVDIFINKINYLPDADEEFLSLKKEDIIKRIKGRIGFEEYKKDLEKKDIKYLSKFLTLITLGKKELCEELKNWLEEKNLLKEF